MRKKEKYSKKKTRQKFLAGLLLAGILFFLLVTTGQKEFSLPHKFGLEILGSLQRVMTAFSDGGAGLWNNYIALVEVRKENAQLRTQILALKEANQAYREAAATNIRLHKLLQRKENLPTPSISADIIGRDPSLWTHTLIINRGSKDGMKKGMPVVSAEGVIGQVVDASTHYAKVLLAIDPNSAIDVLAQRSRMQGILKGSGAGLELYYVLQNADVEEGDILVTSGFGDLFPKGLPVGTVVKVETSKRGLFQKIMVEPAVDFSKLEVVLVLLVESPLND